MNVGFGGVRKNPDVETMMYDIVKANATNFIAIEFLRGEGVGLLTFPHFSSLFSIIVTSTSIFYSYRRQHWYSTYNNTI